MKITLTKFLFVAISILCILFLITFQNSKNEKVYKINSASKKNIEKKENEHRRRSKIRQTAKLNNVHRRQETPSLETDFSIQKNSQSTRQLPFGNESSTIEYVQIDQLSSPDERIAKFAKKRQVDLPSPDIQLVDLHDKLISNPAHYPEAPNQKANLPLWPSIER